MSTLHTLLDRAEAAHDLAAELDRDYFRRDAVRGVEQVDATWCADEPCGLVEDDADRLGVAVFAAYVVTLEAAVEAERWYYIDTFGEIPS